MTVLIVGYGHPLRSDDYAGVCVVDHLRRQLQRFDVVCVTAHALYPELAAQIKNAHRVLFVDACADQAPGEITFRQLAPEQTPMMNGALASHHLMPEALLQMTQQLYGFSPQAGIFTIGGQNFGYGQTLSHVVMAHLPLLVEQITDYLRTQLKPVGRD